MADPKGPETGDGGKGGQSARPRAQTLDLSAKDVSPKPTPGSEPAAKPAEGPKPAVDNTAKPAAAAGTVTGGAAAPAALKGDPKAEGPKAETSKTDAPKTETPKPDTAKPAPAGAARPAGAVPTSSASGASAAAKPAASTAAPAAPRREGVGPLGVVAAAIGGAAIAVIVIAAFGKQLIGLPEPDSTRVSAAEAKLDGVGRDVAALREQLAKTAQSTDTSAIDARLGEMAKSIEASNGRVGGVEAELKSLSDKVSQPPAPDPAVAVMAGRVDGLDLRLQSAPTVDALNVLGGRIAGIEARTTDLPTKDAVADVANRITAMGAAVEGVGQKIDAATAPLKTQIDQLAAQPKGDQSARLVVALGALDQALSDGRPFVSELAAAKAATGGGELSALDGAAAKGLPTREALGAELSAILGKLAPPRSSEPQSVFQRFVANAGGVVKITPQGGAAGSDPAAARDRVAAMGAAGDVAGALAARGALDEAARAATDAWAQTATQRLAAESAVAGARTAALARLSAND